MREILERSFKKFGELKKNNQGTLQELRVYFRKSATFQEIQKTRDHFWNMVRIRTLYKFRKFPRILRKIQKAQATYKIRQLPRGSRDSKKVSVASKNFTDSARSSVNFQEVQASSEKFGALEKFQEFKGSFEKLGKLVRMFMELLKKSGI